MSELNEDELRRLLGTVINLEDSLNKTIRDISDLRVRLAKILFPIESVKLSEKPSKMKVRDINVILKYPHKLVFKVTTENLDVIEFEAPLDMLDTLYNKLRYFKNLIEEKGESEESG